MSFEQKIRDRIAAAPLRSSERSILKLVLGEIQQQKCVVDEKIGYSIVKKILEGNTKTLALITDQDDPRYTQYTIENVVLNSLLPNYLTEEEILAKIVELGLVDQIKATEKEAKAMGLVMPTFKRLDLPVDGEDVKRIIQSLRG
jgi:hypothetical protein